MPLTSRDLPTLTSDEALEIEKSITECIYTKVSHCLSTDSLVAATNLRESLIQYANQTIGIDDLKEKRLDLLRSLHKDLGRLGHYLGSYEPLIETDQRFHKSVLDTSKSE